MFLKIQLPLFDEIPLLQIMPSDVELSHLGKITPICGQQNNSMENKVLRTRFDYDIMPKSLLS